MTRDRGRPLHAARVVPGVPWIPGDDQGRVDAQALIRRRSVRGVRAESWFAVTARNVPMVSFDHAPPLVLSKMFAQFGDIKGAYTRYSVKGHVACFECVAVLHEAGGAGLPPRSARWSRRTPDKQLLLCSEHKDSWRALDEKRFGVKK